MTAPFQKAVLEHQTYQQNPSRIELKALPSGALPVGDWLDAMIARGMGFHATIGTFSAPVSGGGAGTIVDLDQPEGIISVPSGTAIRPVRFSVQCQTPLIAADANEVEILIALDRAAAYDGTGTVTSEASTVFNMRTDQAIGSSCTVVSAATADVTNPTLGMELARCVRTADVQGTAANALWGDLELLYEPKNPPFIVGPAALYIYWGGTVATTGFAQCQWVEFPSTLINDLT